MFQTNNANNWEEKSARVDPTKKIGAIVVKYDEFPDRNTYIHGLSFEGEKKLASYSFNGPDNQR